MSDDSPAPATDLNPPAPTIALIGGSGLGETFKAGDGATVHEHIETPFGRPSGAVVETTFDGVRVLLLSRHGDGHVLNPSQVPYRANIFALKQLGASAILASGACGSLREEFAPRDLVIPDQTIDKTHRRANTFYESAAVHVEFADPFCPVLRGLLKQAGEAIDAAVHDGGTYVCMEGPSFSSRAESRMHRLWGGDLIGMTLLPEARLAREAELSYAAVNLVTDYDAWRPRAADAPTDPFELLSEIIGHLKQASTSAMSLLRETVKLIAAEPGRLDACPAREALSLSIWSDKFKLDSGEIERLAPLWGRHFRAEGEAISPENSPAVEDSAS